MSVPNWPATLPNMELSGFALTGPANVLRTPMDAGPAKQRRRFTSGPRPVTGRVTLDSVQIDEFTDFYRNSLLDGALRFSWTDPLTGDPAEFRFTAPYEATKRGARLFTVVLPLEIMP